MVFDLRCSNLPVPMTQPDIKPNFFIIGAPRCGTTAMSSYLAEHPDVCFAEPKEPLFFCTDMPRLRLVETQNEYLTTCFDPARRESCPAVGEGSVWYLYSAEAVPNILEFNPAARFIVMLRNPADMLASLHRKLMTYADEDVADFERAWSLQQQRANGQNVPRYCKDPKLLQYAQIGRVGRQLQRLYERVAPDRRLVVLFDDFVNDPRATYETVLDFLGIVSDGRERFDQVNENEEVLSPTLLRHAWNPPQMLLNIAAPVRRLLGIERLGILPRIRSSLTRRAPRPATDQSFRAAILAELGPDIDLLGNLLGRDLSHWKS